MTPTLYISHPYSAPTASERDVNLMAAECWFGWIARRYVCIPRAPWMVLVRVWSEVTGRELGIQIDCEEVSRCDHLVQCGNRVQHGGRREAAVARSIIDLVKSFSLKLPPTNETILAQMDELFDCVGVRRR